MIESTLIIHWNTRTPPVQMVEIQKVLRAVLDDEVKANTLSYKLSEPKVV